MAAERPDSDALLSEFVGLTGVDRKEARAYLEANQWDISSAAAEYFTSLEEAEDPSAQPPQPASNPTPDTSRQAKIDPTLQPIPVTSSLPSARASASKPQPKKKFATLGDLSGGGGSSHAGHGHDDESDDDEEEDQDFFAGGEKSALAVQNPDEIKRKILERARRNAARPGGDDPAAPRSHFTGTAQTLGGDDTPSRVIEDPNQATPRHPPPVQRILHFWHDGFSIDDGPLYRADDPANAETLRRIRAGEAPLGVMNVQRNQQVDVKLVQHSEKYVASKKYTPFAGGGHRLGSPTPGPGPSTEISERPTTSNAGSSLSQEPSTPAIQIDESVPSLSLQIRLGDGTRLVSRFNASHTIGDVYSFVAASSPSSQGRNWVLMTTFPSKELQDKTQKLGDIAEFKRGGVVIQKWQ